MVSTGAAGSSRFTALDSLRGLAAVGVAVHHIPAATGPASWALFRNGALFVDVFFVLSGFVIAGVYGARLAQGFALPRFAWLRLGRVWPLHAVMVLAGLALELAALAFGTHGLSTAPPFQGLHDPLHFVTALFLLDGFIPGWDTYYSRASWSISVEILLYALAAAAFRTGRAGLAAFGVLALGAAAALVAGWEAPVATVAVQRGVTGFALGMGCWYIHQHYGAALRSAWPGLREATALAALAAMIAAAPPYPTLATLAPAALVVLVLAQEQGAVSRMLCARPWVWLGQVSYALYMVHAMVKGRVIDALVVLSARSGVPLAGWTGDGAQRAKTLLLPPLASTLVQLAILAAMLATAHLAHRLIEEPARQWARRRSARP